MKALDNFVRAVSNLERNHTEQDARRAYWTSRHYFVAFYDLALATNGRYRETIGEFVDASKKCLKVLKGIAQTEKLEWTRLLGHRIALRQRYAEAYKEGGLEAVSAELQKAEKVFVEGYRKQGRFPIIIPYNFEGVS